AAPGGCRHGDDVRALSGLRNGDGGAAAEAEFASIDGDNGGADGGDGNADGKFDRIFEEACRVIRRAPGDGDDGGGVVLPESLAGPDEAIVTRGEQMAHDRWNLLDLTAHVAGHLRSSPSRD